MTNAAAMLDGIRRAQRGDREAAGKLVEENSGLIWSIARRFFGRGVEADDLYQLGCVGFLKAIEGFDRGADKRHLARLFLRNERNRLLRKIENRERIDVRHMVGDEEKGLPLLLKLPKILDPIDFPIDPEMVQDENHEFAGNRVAFLDRGSFRVAGIAPKIEGVVPQKPGPSQQENAGILQHAYDFSICS